jgi:hypothetical protein
MHRASYPMAVVSPMRSANPRFSDGSGTHRRVGMRIEIADPDGPARATFRVCGPNVVSCVFGFFFTFEFAILHCLASSSARILELPRRDIQTGPDARPLLAGSSLTRRSQAS